MSETPNDPAGSTTQFQYFAQQGQAEQSSGPSKGPIIGIAVGVVVIVAIIAVALAMM